MALNLEKQLLFYGSYHHNPVNVWIHIVCVPIILMSILLLLTNTPSLPLPSWLSFPHLPLNVGTFGAVLYSSLYILMEPVVGGLMAPLIIGGTAYSHYLTQTYGKPVNIAATVIQAISWILQFIGHGKFEGRAPALLDNLVQALFLAPFFVFFEVMFMLGYRPELKARLDKNVEEELKKLNKSKPKKGTRNGSANGSAKEL
ncbi:DUF962-domain-containing protein [Rhizodiscina lignyota]|uniref:DUF962-domain-containing protein n=1 Tax=Rhizodiscina lignyota TaxID=1504668 RepID=A0A9P4M6U6_9PEZI|nr:DUF962-domain-containing protein [Rhizodiscina lignyota]